MLLFQAAFSQEIIRLVNPSFEAEPAEGRLNGPMPKGWIDCGFPLQSTPDIHPVQNSLFGVDTPPRHGQSYLGLVVRENESWEMIGQPEIDYSIENQLFISIFVPGFIVSSKD